MGFERISKITLIAAFVGLAVGFGYALAFLPNIELITFTIFTSGIILGPIYAALVGILSFSIYSAFNPYGMAPLPLFIVQIFSGGIIGLFGGIFSKGLKKIKKHHLRALLASTIGIVVTVIYDILTNIAAYISIGNPELSLWVFIVAGLSFSLLHIISNGLVFFFLSFVWRYV
ncbi:MAG: ECF transporter S component [bacterium]